MAMLLITLPFAKKGAAAPAPKAPKPAAVPLATADETAALRRQLADAKLSLELYRIVLERYQKFIEDGEAKSVAELRELVRPLDSVVTEMKIVISDQFHPYLYEKHFLPAVEKALDLIFAFKPVSLPVNFWLSFNDMSRLHAADDIDRAILLCSLLRSLGSESARVLIDKGKGAWVSFIYGDKQYMVDIAKRTMTAYPAADDGLKVMLRSVQYAFNDREYEDLSEG
ncbi:MAG: hypothetical protein KGH63_01450 [Candidatus Micrarchaeota archaeon]|nr:hypothetical protein [Candidatus Micrarchaeota archaeon]